MPELKEGKNTARHAALLQSFEPRELVSLPRGNQETWPLLCRREGGRVKRLPQGSPLYQEVGAPLLLQPEEGKLNPHTPRTPIGRLKIKKGWILKSASYSECSEANAILKLLHWPIWER